MAKIANEITKEDLQVENTKLKLELSSIKINQQIRPMPILTEEMKKRDDILTQQMISTYRRHIAPLVILSEE